MKVHAIALCVIILAVNSISHTIDMRNNSNPSLISKLVTHLQSQPTPKLFQTIIHPIAQHEPHLFGSIMHKLLRNENQSPFNKYFIKSATRTIFAQYILVRNRYVLSRNITTLDVWRLLNLCHKDDIFDLYIHQVSYKPNINKFYIVTKIRSTHLAIRCSGHTHLNFSEIPPFLTSFHVTYASPQPPAVVDLTPLQHTSHLEALSLYVSNGTIIFPQHSFTSALKQLEIIAPSIDMDYHTLWNAGGYLENLVIQSKGMNQDDFVGIENMRHLSQLKISCSHDSWSHFRWYGQLIKHAFERAGVLNQTIMFEGVWSYHMQHIVMGSDEDGVNSPVRSRNALNIVRLCLFLIAFVVFLILAKNKHLL